MALAAALRHQSAAQLHGAARWAAAAAGAWGSSSLQALSPSPCSSSSASAPLQRQPQQQQQFQQHRGLSSNVGFEKHIGESQRGKVFLVTGSTSGIGRHTADLLALHGGTVLIHGRSLSRVKRAIRELRAAHASSKIYGYCYDISTLGATEEFAAHVTRDMHNLGLSIDVLVNNAGVFEEDHHVTPEGLERTWAVNVAAPFLLTSRLLPLVTERIVNVTSISVPDKLEFDNLQSDKGYEREGHAAYGMSKLALNMWSYMLADRLREAGSPLGVSSVDPGTVATQILYNGWGELSIGVAMRADEADDEYWAATCDDVSGSAGYFVNRRLRKSTSFTYDRQQQQRLWHTLEQQTGATWPGLPELPLGEEEEEGVAAPQAAVGQAAA